MLTGVVAVQAVGVSLEQSSGNEGVKLHLEALHDPEPSSSRGPPSVRTSMVEIPHADTSGRVRCLQLSLNMLFGHTHTLQCLQHREKAWDRERGAQTCLYNPRAQFHPFSRVISEKPLSPSRLLFTTELSCHCVA